MSTLRNFFALHPAQRDHLPAARIALSVAVPLVAVMAAGRADLSIYVAFGAFTSIYARLEPTGARARHQSQAGVLLTLCVALGALLSGAPEAVVLAVTAVVAGLGAMAAAFWGLRPAGSVFFIFAVGAVGSLEDAAPVWQAAALAAASAGFSVALGLASRWAGEGVTGPVAPVPEHHGLSTGQLWAHGGRFLAELFVGRNYSLALLFITPLALLMTQLAAPSAPGELLQARAVETVIGAVCGLAVVHLTRSAAERGLSGPSRRGRRPGAPGPRDPRRTPPAPRG